MKGEQPRIMLLMDTNRAYERGLLRGVLRYSRLHGPLSFWRKQHVVSGGPRRISLKMIREWRPDGIIWREGYCTLDIKSLGVPTVFAPYRAPDPQLLNVVSGDAAIGAKVVDHFLRRGFRHFAYYSHSDSLYFSRARRAAFTTGVQQAGCEVSYCCRDETPDVAAWLGAQSFPLGLMVATDDCAADCYAAAREAGLAIPQDLAIIGVGNDELICDFAIPPLSSVGMNTEHAGYEAARALIDMIEGRAPGRDIVCDACEVTERPSTSVLAVEDRVIASAIQFIRSRLGENLHVEDVVRAMPVSRRALYTRFKLAVGRSIYDEIRLAKMDYAARMLTDTDMSIAAIAEKLGYGDAKNLARVFRHAKGLPPLKYRMQYSPYR
ncbi:MAG: substrate-binding domain-containing protein [Verrucomicrobia bacterium]|jgi:LacI family transcriptional regulator|nr:substrate-binding domain-containing protein [Verrucomicrobiota bacterium]